MRTRILLLLLPVLAQPLACGSDKTCIPGLDCSFGFAGYRLAPVQEPARAVAVLPDGRIRAVGNSTVAQEDVFVFGVTAGGSPDGLLGANGTATLFRPGNQIVSDMAVQPDGKILIEATASLGTNARIAVFRMNEDGTLDATFGSGGETDIDYGPDLAAVTDSAGGLALLPDGSVVVSATAVVGTGTDFALSRLTATGALDATFGVNGTVTRSLAEGIDDRVKTVVVGSGGTILVAGNTAFGGVPHAAILSFNPDGSVHSVFGGGAGEAVRPEPIAVRDLTLQPDGKILLAGPMDDGTGATDFGIERFGSDGFLDLGFGAAGIATLDLGTSLDRLEGLAVAADGTILAAGSTYNGAPSLTLARVLPSGTLGEVTKVLGGHAFGITIAPSTRAVVTGDYAGHMAVVRIKP